MKRVEPELLWQILRTDRKEVNVEAVRLRNQIQKYMCSEQPITLNDPPSVSVRTAASYHYPLLVLSHHQVASNSWPEDHRLVLWEAGTTYIRTDLEEDPLPEIYIAAV